MAAEGSTPTDSRHSFQAAMTAIIRLATSADAPAIAAIYRPFCEASAVSFEFAAPTPEEMAERIRAVGAQYPWLVLEDGGNIAGYAYASRHAERAAYGWAVNTSVYISGRHRRCGVGDALYTTLFELLRLEGLFKAYAGITLPNEASTRFHEAMGFSRIGVYEGVGYKHGAWHDVAWYQRALQPERIEPSPPLPVSALFQMEGWAEAMARGMEKFRARTM